MILLAGLIESISTRKDRTLKLSISTQEITPAAAADIFTLSHQFAYMAFKPEPFTDGESAQISDMKTDLSNIKSPCQRLRAVLYLSFTQDAEGFNDFAMYYASKMERIIDHYKLKLNEKTY